MPMTDSTHQSRGRLVLRLSNFAGGHSIEPLTLVHKNSCGIKTTGANREFFVTVFFPIKFPIHTYQLSRPLNYSTARFVNQSLGGLVLWIIKLC